MTSVPDSTSPRRGPGRPSGAQSQEGREALLRAARELMNEKGFSRVTAREVADRAGVKPALVNYYFGGKDDLLREVILRLSEEMRDRLASAVASEGSFEERLREVIRTWVSALAEDPYAPALMIERVIFGDDDVLDTFSERFGKPNLQAISALLEEGRNAGEARDGDPMHLIPSMLGACLFYFLGAPIQRRVLGVDPLSPERVQAFEESVADLVLHGISTRARPEESGS
jgi:TetR/AcrR family transcriptional regulator